MASWNGKSNYFQVQDRNAFEVSYKKKIYPDQNDVENLVKETDLNEKQIKCWFKNKRKKAWMQE